jgi:hypothetical protein
MGCVTADVLIQTPVGDAGSESFRPLRENIHRLTHLGLTS